MRQHDRHELLKKWAECGLCGQRYHGAVASAMAWGAWKTYVSRPEGDALRGFALCVMGLTKGMNNEEALRAATAYRDWCGRFDTGNIPGADENLALTYSSCGRHDEAIFVLQRIRAAKLLFSGGSEYLESVISLLNLVTSLVRAKRYDQTIQLLSESRPAACQALGEDHVQCLSLAHILGTAHLLRGADMGDFLAAGAIFRDVNPRNRKVLGPDHPRTRTTERTFVQALEALEKAGCEADILEKLCNGVLRGGWHSKESEPRSRKQYEPRARK